MINVADLIITLSGEKNNNNKTLEQHTINSSAASEIIIDGLKSIGSLMFHAAHSDYYDNDSLRVDIKSIGCLIETNAKFLERILAVESDASYQLKKDKSK